MKRAPRTVAPRTAHLHLVPPTSTPVLEQPAEPRTFTAAEVARRWPKSDPKEVAAVQDTLMAQTSGICAAWYEGGVFKFVRGRVVG